MPGLRAPCGIYEDANDKRWHFVVELYFRDFLVACDSLYEEITHKSANEARRRAGL